MKFFFFILLFMPTLVFADFSVVENTNFLNDTVASSVVVSDGNFVDSYRVLRYVPLLVLFFVSSLYVAGKDGLKSFFALIFSVFYGFYILIPYLSNSSNILFLAFLVIVLMLLNLLITHGFNRKTLRAFNIMALITLVFLFISNFFTDFLYLTGAGSEEAFFLQVSNNLNFDLRLILNLAVVLGTFGILDDVVISQMSIVDRLKKANPKYNFKTLYSEAMIVGRHHIASLINTLFFAYMAAFLPWLIVMHVDTSMPIWFRLNTEMFTEEFLRIILGSTALILAVPLTTFVQSYKYKK